MRGMCVLGLLSLVGCTSEVARRPTGPEVGNQGGAWEVVLAGGGTPLEADGPEVSRRDLAMAPEPSYSTVDWPAADQPSLDDARYLFLPRRANEVLYFGSWHPYWSGYRRWR
jgi:hypothetical protein